MMGSQPSTPPAPGAPRPPQLRMRFLRFDALPPMQLPPGYSLRSFLPGDEEGWTGLLNSTRSLGEWDRARCTAWMSEHRIDPNAVQIIEYSGAPAATTLCVAPKAEGARPELGWVAVSPQHQGRSLGYHVCLAVLHYMKRMGYRECFLLTDDFRVPAIKTYLKLGFEPEMSHETHPARWQALNEQLGRR
jgi:mycothiol synthase